MSTPGPIIAVFGCTGFVGSHILSTLLASDAYGAVHSISRRTPKQASAEPAPTKLHTTIDADAEKFPSKLAGLQPGPAATVFSALGTTRAQAGSLAGQWKIDHDLNVEIVQAAKAAGASTFVFVSSAGTGGAGAKLLPYSKMKLGVETAVRSAGFEQAIILRPGLIMGARTDPHGGFGNGIANAVVGGLRRLNQGLGDAFGQDALVIGRAAVAADVLAREGKAPAKVWVLEQADIVRLGRTEWKEKEAAAAAPPKEEVKPAASAAA